MAKWASSTVLDGGLNAIKTGVRERLIKAYSAGDSHATVTGNTVAVRTLATGNYTISTTGTARKIVVATGTATASASTTGTPDLHIAICTTGAVLFVTDETSNQSITSGNTVNFPALTYKSLQPT
jgi:hypothetical protein